MQTKDELVSSIKGWIGIDSEIARLSKELKRKEPKKITEDLVTTMKSNDIDCFDIK